MLCQFGSTGELSFSNGDFELTCQFFSGALDNVQQLSFEFHYVDQNIPEFWKIIQNLYHLGFKVISYDPNFCSATSGKGFYKLFEILFRRTDACA